MIRNHLNHTQILNTDTLKEINSFINKERTREKNYKENKVILITLNLTTVCLIVKFQVYSQNVALLKMMKLNQKMKKEHNSAVLTKHTFLKPKDVSTIDSSISSQKINTSKNFFSKSIPEFGETSICDASILEQFLQESVALCNSKPLKSHTPIFPEVTFHSKQLDEKAVNFRVSKILQESKWLFETYADNSKTDKESYNLNPDQFKKLSEKLMISEQQLKQLLKSVINTTN